MKIVLLIIFTSIYIFANEQKVNIGISTSDFYKNNQSAKITFKLIENSFNQKKNNVQIKFIHFKTTKELFNSYINNKIQIIVTNFDEYFKKEKILKEKTNALWTIPFNNTNSEQLYLIKNKKLDFKINDIHKYVINYKDYSRPSEIWFRNFIYNEKKQSYKNFIKKENFNTKISQLNLKPFFDKTQISVVYKSDYDLMMELNPQIKNRVEILKKSKISFITNIGLVNKSIKEEDYKKLLKLFSGFKYLEKRNRIKSKLTLNKLTLLEKEKIDEQRDYYKNYYKKELVYDKD